MADRTDADLDIYSDHRFPTTTVTASATAVAGTRYSVDTTSGNVTMTLPALALAADGQMHVFYKTVAANSMIVDANGSETIEGSANVTRTAQYSTVTIRKAGAAWQLVKADANTESSGSQIVQEFTLDVDFSDLGSGASDAIALTGFPTGVYVLGAFLEVNTAFAGEADLACTVGDTGDADGLLTSTNLNAVAADSILAADGAETGFHYEADYATAGADITFTATELDDVTAGNLTVHVLYIQPALLT